MPLHPTWSDLATRLVCAVVVGALFGLDRSEHGRVAGLRTTALVCLAACLAMIQANLLLSVAGKTPDSFVQLDMMRLPLGILSGMGFIGAGAIVRRENMIIGVTTAATIWFVTVIGLCFGGGQFSLGGAGSVIGLAVLAGLKIVDDRIQQEHLGSLLIAFDSSAECEGRVRGLLENSGFRILSCAVTTNLGANSRELMYDLLWRADARATKTPEAICRLTHYPGITRFAWTPKVR